jgi:outer membrane receptor protein involved in Fe transport
VQEVVVTAQKREEKLVDVAGAVSAVGAKQISQLNARTRPRVFGAELSASF